MIYGTKNILTLIKILLMQEIKSQKTDKYRTIESKIELENQIIDIMNNIVSPYDYTPAVSILNNIIDICNDASKPIAIKNIQEIVAQSPYYDVYSFGEENIDPKTKILEALNDLVVLNENKYLISRTMCIQYDNNKENEDLRGSNVIICCDMIQKEAQEWLKALEKQQKTIENPSYVTNNTTLSNNNTALDNNISNNTALDNNVQCNPHPSIEIIN